MEMEINPLLRRAHYRFEERINPQSPMLEIREDIRKKHYYFFNWPTIMNLYDPYGKHHTVDYDPKSNPTGLTSGWTDMLQFYRIQDEFLIEFSYVGVRDFVIKIKNDAGWEIAYKGFNENLIQTVGEMEPVMEFTHILTSSEASRSHLDIPYEAAKYVRKHGSLPWKLVGPSGRIIECRTIIPKEKERSYVAKFGSGWKAFCVENNLKEDDNLCFQFTNPYIRKVKVGYVL